MTIKLFTKHDTSIFKGIGILLIVFHNYLHWVKPNTGENEFWFSAEHIKNLWNGIIETPFETVNLLFSYFGHYGVQVFIFISGLGLAISMLNKPKNYGTYFVSRMKKYIPMLIIMVVFYFFFYVFTKYKLMTIVEWRQLLWKFLSIHTLLPQQSLSLNGPWWFLGLIFQMYLLFPLLFKIIKRFRIWGLVAICGFSYLCTFSVAYFWHLPDGVDWMANSIAHLPEFAFGIYIALNAGKKIHPTVFIAAFVIFALGNFSKDFYYFSFLAITILLYGLIVLISDKLLVKTKYINNVLQNIGRVSMSIFLVHGMFRWFFICALSDSWWEKLIGVVLFFIASYGVAMIAETFYKWQLKAIGKIEDRIGVKNQF